MIADRPNLVELSFMQILHCLWRDRLVLFSLLIISTASASAYVIFATPWYQATVLLAPSKEEGLPALPSGLGGLVNLATLSGISVGGGSGAEAIATLRSRDFARSFIEDNDLIPLILYERWDEERGRWKDEDPDKIPDVRDAVKYFQTNVLSVSEDRSTGLVELSIEWTDAHLAASWAGELVQRLNERMRMKALVEAERNVSYLKQQLDETSLASLRDAIGSLLETELQKVMLARGKNDFAFTVIDSPQVPKKAVKPRRVITVALAAVLGILAGIVFVVLKEYYRLSRSGPNRKAS